MAHMIKPGSCSLMKILNFIQDKKKNKKQYNSMIKYFAYVVVSVQLLK